MNNIKDLKANSNTSITRIASKSLPALSGSSLTYNPEKNLFLTTSYTSGAGNSYYRVIRVSDRLAIFYHIGEGYKYTFLNGITMYCWDGQHAKMIAQKFWGGSDWRCYSDSFAKEQSILMLKDYLVGQAKILGAPIIDQEILAFSREMVESTQQKRLAA